MDNEKEKEFVIDIGTPTSLEEETPNNAISSDRPSKKLLSRTPSGVLSYNGSDKGDVSGNAGCSGRDSIEVMIDKNLGNFRSEEHVPLVEKKHGKEKRKTFNSKKASKPPRPPKGPSLNAYDMKLVKEISDLTIKKRARMERMKALKKAKAVKSSSPASSSSTLAAMIVTAIFFIVIILQGFCSKNVPAVSLPGSPEPAIEPKGLISVGFYHLSPSAALNSKSPSKAEVPTMEISAPG